MQGAQSSEHGQGGIRERAIQLANVLPNEFATPILKFLGFERPELSRYYVEVDCAIQTFLQKKLKELGYSDVIPEPLGRDNNNLNNDRFAYGYLLSYTGKKRTQLFVEGYILGARQGLVNIIQSSDVEFDNFPNKGDHIYARVRPGNSLYVAKARSEK